VFNRFSDDSDLSAELGSLTIWLPAKSPEPLGYRVKAIATTKLVGAMEPVARAEFQWRMSTPVSALLLTLAAIPLSRSRPRQGRYAKMLLALAIYAIYFNLLDVARSWVEQGSSAYIWWVPGLLSMVVAAMYLPVMFRKRKDRRAQD
jgi:lipopolysaccharide export system permease protein